MSPFDHTIHFELFGYCFNAGILWKGKVGLSPDWKNIGPFYFCKPFKWKKRDL